MRVTSLDRLRLQEDLRDTRAMTRPVPLLLMKFARTSYDTDTQTGLDITQGDGTGQDTAFQVYTLQARLQMLDHNTITFGHVPPSVGEGDLALGIGLRDKAVVQRGVSDEHSYIYMDGVCFHPVELVSSGLGHDEEYILYAKRFTPLQRLAGF